MREYYIKHFGRYKVLGFTGCEYKRGFDDRENRGEYRVVIGDEFYQDVEGWVKGTIIS